MIAFVDYRITNKELNKLHSFCDKIIKTPKSDNLYEAINGHTDIQINVISKSDRLLIVQKDIDKNFLNLLDENNLKYIFSNNSLTYTYPGNIILNGLILNNFFIHNTKFTDPNLLLSVKEKKIINVKQGYTNCSILKVTDNAFITSDLSIFKELKKFNFDILLLPPGDIILEGLNYGFIGGTGGLIKEDLMIFFGSLDHYIHGDLVKNFLKKYNVNYINLNNDIPLIDRGGIFTI